MEFSWVIGGTPESFGHWLSVETTSLKWGSHMTFQNPPIYLAFSPTFWMFILTLFRTPLYRLFHPTFWMFYFDISLATNQKKTPKFPICLLAKLYTSGWWFQPLWKNISQLGRIIPYIMEKMFQTTNQLQFIHLVVSPKLTNPKQPDSIPKQCQFWRTPQELWDHQTR